MCKVARRKHSVPFLRGTSWRNNRSSARNGSRFEYHIWTNSLLPSFHIYVNNIAHSPLWNYNTLQRAIIRYHPSRFS